MSYRTEAFKVIAAAMAVYLISLMTTGHLVLSLFPVPTIILLRIVGRESERMSKVLLFFAISTATGIAFWAFSIPLILKTATTVSEIRTELIKSFAITMCAGLALGVFGVAKRAKRK